MQTEVVDGDLLDQPVEVIVNAWNRNIIPWWLLLSQGVSGAIRRRGGLAPFRELGRIGPIPLGEAVLTGAGRLPFRAIIHVAGINLFWRASEASIRGSVRSAMALAERHGYASIAFPVIGAGSGGLSEGRALVVMLEALEACAGPPQRRVVRFHPPNRSWSARLRALSPRHRALLAALARFPAPGWDRDLDLDSVPRRQLEAALAEVLDARGCFPVVGTGEDQGWGYFVSRSGDRFLGHQLFSGGVSEPSVREATASDAEAEAVLPAEGGLAVEAFADSRAAAEAIADGLIHAFRRSKAGAVHGREEKGGGA